jgi:Ca-activated chloride channel family protein
VGNGREDTLGELVFHVKISSDIPIQSVFSPTHKVDVTVRKEQEATVSFEGSQVQPNKDFVLYISQSKRAIDLSLVAHKKEGEDGYFLLMLAPKVDKKVYNPKDVVFVFDTSGSMAGEPMDQAKAALKYCLNSLRENDRFNIVPFSTEARPYKDSLIEVNKKNLQDALAFTDQEIYARGGTNIDEALSLALNVAPAGSDRPFMVVFMTDGKPTIGVRDVEEIIKRVRNKNVKQLRLFTFGVGVDLNTHLVDRLAEENRGTHEYATPGEDIEIKISSFFDKISSPVLSNIKIQFPSADGLRVTEEYPRTFSDLFSGAQVNMLGRYSGSGDQVIRLTGTMDGKEQTFDFETKFPQKNNDNDEIPRLWAVRKVGFLLDQIRLYGEDKEVKQEVIRLAKKFGIVTPYTSYLVLEDTPSPVTTPRVMEESVRDAFSSRPQSPRGDSKNDMETAKKEREAAKTAMKSEEGKNAVDASRTFGNMKEASVEDEVAGGKGSYAKDVMRKINEKTFYRKGDVWYDSEYKEGMKTVRIQYLSDEYMKLMQDHTDICKFLAVSAQIVIVWEGKVYEIYNS